MSMLSRRHCSMWSKHIQRHAKTLGRGTKVKSPVPAGRQVGTESTCNEGKGMRKRETFRTTEGNIFSLTSFSSVNDTIWASNQTSREQWSGCSVFVHLPSIRFSTSFGVRDFGPCHNNTEGRKSKAVVRVPNNQKSASIRRMRCQIWLLLLRSALSLPGRSAQRYSPREKIALLWTCIIAALAFGKKVTRVKHNCVHYRQKEKNKEKELSDVKLQHNIAASLPPWLNQTFSLRDRSTHRWTQKGNSKEKELIDVKLQHNIAASLPPWLNPPYRLAIGRLTDELDFDGELSFRWSLLACKKSDSRMVKRKIRVDYLCLRWTGSSK